MVFALLPLGRSSTAAPSPEVWRAAGVAPVVVAKPAPRLRLSGIDGRAIDTFRERDRLTMLYFWATW
jgi:hypothetical protein